MLISIWSSAPFNNKIEMIGWKRWVKNLISSRNFTIFSRFPFHQGSFDSSRVKSRFCEGYYDFIFFLDSDTIWKQYSKGRTCKPQEKISPFPIMCLSLYPNYTSSHHIMFHSFSRDLFKRTTFKVLHLAGIPSTILRAKLYFKILSKVGTHSSTHVLQLKLTQLNFYSAEVIDYGDINNNNTYRHNLSRNEIFRHSY